MDLELLDFVLSLWLFALVVSGYATYHAYEYGMFNAKGTWIIIRFFAAIISYLALGLSATTFCREFTGNWLYHLIVFIVGFSIAVLILNFVQSIIASPYKKAEEEKSEFNRKMREAKED